METTIQTIAVIGAGPAGRAFALRCARAGFTVVLEDVMPANLRRAGEEFAEFADAANRIRYALTVEDAVRTPGQPADLVIDFVPDELESKLEIFSLLDRIAPPHTILCTPTTVLSITDLASCTYRTALCVGLRLDPDATTADLIQSRFADPTMLAAVEGFFHRLSYTTTLTPDTIDPMLMKNLIPTAAPQ